MPVQAARSEVKFKVRRNALLLGEFTIAQLVRATGLKPESVRTEVQRLRREGMVISERRPGRREAFYRLSDDPEKRLDLSRSVETFYPEPPSPIPPRPTSRMYQAALRSLDQAEEMEEGRRRAKLLAQAAHQLEGAWQAEGASRAPELVQAHLLREHGRLASLQGQREAAIEMLTEAKQRFTVAGLESEVRLIDEYLLCIEAWRLMEASRAANSAARVRCVLEALKATGFFAIGPLTRLLTDLAWDLSRTLEDRVAHLTLMIETHRETVETHSEVSEMREELRRLGERVSIPILSREKPDMPTELIVETPQLFPEHGREIALIRSRSLR
jgi:DNA-binding transcriptional ArsR family regulator